MGGRATEVTLVGIHLSERQPREGASQLKNEESLCKCPEVRKWKEPGTPEGLRDANCDWGLRARGERQETK